VLDGMFSIDAFCVHQNGQHANRGAIEIAPKMHWYRWRRNDAHLETVSVVREIASDDASRSSLDCGFVFSCREDEDTAHYLACAFNTL
jgi:hypothetical protein